jgi:hypothetical protein
MEELEVTDLSIWVVEKEIFSIISKYISNTMLLYPSYIRVRRTKEHLNRCSHEEMSAKIPKLLKVWRPCPYHIFQAMQTSQTPVFLHWIYPWSFVDLPYVIGVDWGIRRTLLGLQRSGQPSKGEIITHPCCRGGALPLHHLHSHCHKICTITTTP